MPEQITPLSILYLLLHGAGTHAARTTAPLDSCIIRHHGHGPRLVDTVLHVPGRHPLVDLRTARRYRLHDAAPRLHRHTADHAAGPPPTAVAHFRRHDALCGDRSAANQPAIHRSHNPEQSLWAGPHRGLYYIYGGGRETLWAVVARQLRRPRAQGGVAQPYAAHRPHATAHVL